MVLEAFPIIFYTKKLFKPILSWTRIPEVLVYIVVDRIRVVVDVVGDMNHIVFDIWVWLLGGWWWWWIHHDRLVLRSCHIPVWGFVISPGTSCDWGSMHHVRKVDIVWDGVVVGDNFEFVGCSVCTGVGDAVVVVLVAFDLLSFVAVNKIL